MQTRTLRGGRARGPVSVGNEAFSLGKGETGCAFHGANMDAKTTPAAHPAANEVAVSGVAHEPATIATVAGDPEPVPANAIGLSRQERLQALERHLRRPFPEITEFYLIDRVDRLTNGANRYADLDEITTHAAQPCNICPFRLGMVLSASVRAGALKKLGQQSGREGSYRITAIGKRYLDQAKAMHVALWKINPLLSIGEICDIVQVEGGDTLSEMITWVKEEEAMRAEIRRQGKRAANKNASSNLAQSMQSFTTELGLPSSNADTAIATEPSPALQVAIHPLWKGLTGPLQRWSYPRK